MFPVGGIGAMLAVVVVAAALLACLVRPLARRYGWLWAASALLLVWTLVVIGAVTLLPASGPVDVVFAEDRLGSCSWDIGGPAPDGFWIFAGGQRLLNAVIFVPSGALLVLCAARWPRRLWLSVPAGLLALVGYSVAIEATQLALARLDRACDVTDVLDNGTGAAIGVLVGVVLALALRPWRLVR